MLAIGRALLAAPDLLLLDEPSEGLAPSLVRRVERTVRDLREREVTVLLVEQNLRVAFEVADHVLVMDDGRIVHEGPTEDVRDDERVLEDRLGVSRLE